MKNLTFIAGILLVSAAVILTFLALFFPDNGMFSALWSAGFFTFRADPSLMLIYLSSALFFVLGAALLLQHVKGNKGDM